MASGLVNGRVPRVIVIGLEVNARTEENYGIYVDDTIYRYYTLGSTRLVFALFSTVGALLEEEWGERFPLTIKLWDETEWALEELDDVLVEIRQIRQEFNGIEREHICWDGIDLTNTVPEDPRVSTIDPQAKYLLECFVTPEGKDMLTLMEEACLFAKQVKRPVRLIT